MNIPGSTVRSCPIHPHPTQSNTWPIILLAGSIQQHDFALAKIKPP